jgi:hypothetical protein
MGDFDQAARWAAEACVGAVLERLGREAGVELRFVGWSPERPTTKPGDPERSADHVLVASEEGKPEAPWLLVFEFQSEHEEDKLDDVLLEVAQLRVRKRHGPLADRKYRVLPVLVYLKGTCPQRELDMRTPSGRGVLHGPLIWEVALDRAADALGDVAQRRAEWGLLFWVALMSGAEDAKVIARWLELVSALGEREQVSLLQVALTFAELAGRYLAWEKALGERYMEGESQFLNRIRERTAKQVELRLQRENTLATLQFRFPGVPIPEDVRELLTQQDSLDLLRDWFRAAHFVASMDEYRAHLRR